jgi:hypothetical protein
MTASEALKAMEAGKCVVAVKRAFDDPEFNGYFRLYRNDTILKLMPDTPCAAMVKRQFTIEKFEELGSYHTFEIYDR